MSRVASVTVRTPGTDTGEKQKELGTSWTSGESTTSKNPFEAGELPGRFRKRSSHGSSLTGFDLTRVGEIAGAGSLSNALSMAHTLEEMVTKARANVVAAVKESEGSIIQRITSLIRTGFGFLNSPVVQAQDQLSSRLEELRHYSDKFIKPVTEEIQRRFHGRTFIRTEKTPRALVLASVPTELAHLNHDFDRLKFDVGQLVLASRGAIKLQEGLGSARIAITRTGRDGKEEVIEFAFRREGKVTVYLNHKELGSAWTGKAKTFAEQFASGGDVKVRSKRYSEYVVKPPKS